MSLGLSGGRGTSNGDDFVFLVDVVADGEGLGGLHKVKVNWWFKINISIQKTLHLKLPGFHDFLSILMVQLCRLHP